MAIKLNPPNAIKKNDYKDKNHSSSEKKSFVKEASKHKPLGQISQTSVDDNNPSQIYPWQDDAVRKDVTRLFNLRLTEPDWLKLKYISDQTQTSMHAICLDVLIPAIHRRLKKIIPEE